MLSLLRAVLLLGVLAPAPASAEIRLIDAATGSARTLIAPKTHMVLHRWTDDGSALLVERDGNVMRLGAADGRLAPAAGVPTGAMLGPGGRSARFVATHSGAAVELRRPDGSASRRVPLPSLWADPQIGWSADGTRFVIVTLDELTVIDADAGRIVLRRTFDDETTLTDQPFAPDRSAVVVTAGRRVLRIALPSGASRTLFTGRRGAWLGPNAAHGPGDRVAVASERRLVLLGTPPADLRLPGDLTKVTWSPAGDTVAAEIAVAPDPCSSPNPGLVLVRDGEPPRTVLAPFEGELASYFWSPDGRTLAVSLEVAATEGERRGKRRPWPKQVARNYEMFSRRGNAAIRSIMLRAARALKRGAGREATLRRMRLDFSEVAERYGEAHDTAVREALGNELDRWLRAAGFALTDATDEYTC